MAAVKDALDPSWINAPGGVGPSYDAEELRRLQGYQLAAGATAGSSRTGILNPRDLIVSLSGSNVLASAGGCVIGTAKGAYVTGVAAVTTIGALLAADVTNPRRDRVVLEILDPDNGGGAGRKAQLRIMDGTPNASAATGGGFPAAPTSPFIDLGFVDVPKSGAGAPSVTINAPLTAAAGAPVPVRTRAEVDTLPKWVGAQASVLSEGGTVYVCDGTTWGLPQAALSSAPSTVTGWTITGGLMKVVTAGLTQVTAVVKMVRTGSAIAVTTGDVSLASVLIPDGFRPPSNHYFPSTVNNNFGARLAEPQLVISASGQLIGRSASGGTVTLMTGATLFICTTWNQ